MAGKENFTKEEWTLLLESPMIAGMAVTAADPSGLWGLLKESFAGGSALSRAIANVAGKCGFAGQPERRSDGRRPPGSGNAISVLT